MYGNGLGLFPYKQASILSLLKSKINIGTILTNTQKTLNIVNQAIPIVYQVKPLYNNAKTVFKIMSAIGTDNKTNKNQNIKMNKINNMNNNVKNITKEPLYNNGPQFFL